MDSLRLPLRAGVLGLHQNHRCYLCLLHTTGTDALGALETCPPGVDPPGGAASRGCIFQGVHPAEVHHSEVHLSVYPPGVQPPGCIIQRCIQGCTLQRCVLQGVHPAEMHPTGVHPLRSASPSPTGAPCQGWVLWRYIQGWTL